MLSVFVFFAGFPDYNRWGSYARKRVRESHTRHEATLKCLGANIPNAGLNIFFLLFSFS
jgi:hypothetical protein